jgi:hypothetical protein
MPHRSAYPKTDIQLSVLPCSSPLFSLDVAIADFYVFGWLKQQFFGRTLDNEQILPETVTEILSELPKDEVKSVFHLKSKLFNLILTASS